MLLVALARLLRAINPRSLRGWALAAILFAAVLPAVAHAQSESATPSGQTAQPVTSETTATPAPATGPDAQSLTADQQAAIDALVKALENDNVRTVLLERLQAASPAAPVVAPSDALEISPAQQLAEKTKSFADDFYFGVTHFWDDLIGVRYVFEGMTPEKRATVLAGLYTVMTTMAIALLLHFAGRRLVGFLLRRFDTNSNLQGEWKNVVAAILRIGGELGALLLAYGLGYIISAALSGSGQLGVKQSLFLNAFLIVGATWIALETLLHPDHPQQTVFRFPARAASVAYPGLVAISGFFIYGLVFVVPLADSWANFATGRALRIIIITATAIWSLFLIRRVARLTAHPKEPAADAAEAGATEPPEPGFWLTVWPMPATLYVVTIWVIGIAQPQLVVDVIGIGSLQVLIVVILTILGLRTLDYIARVEPPLPPRLNRIAPALRERLHAFQPILMRTLSVILVGFAALFVLDAFNLVDARGLLTDPGIRTVISNVTVALLIAFGAMLLWSVVSALIDERLTRDLPLTSDESRKRTLLALFRNAFTVVVLVFAVMTGLSQIGLDIAPLLAGAGVVGLAIGFGAQKLVQDVITGIFIQIENAINVGDVVTVAGKTGVVERLTIRSVGMRDLEGVYHIVPFSAVDTVSNFMRKFAFHVAEVGVSYKSDISQVREAMLEAFDRLKHTEHGKHIIGDFEMHGVTALADSSVNVRGRIKTRPGEQWAVGRAYTELVKKVFDERGIEIPYPHRTMVYQGGLPPEVGMSVAQMIKDSPKSGVTDPAPAAPKPRQSRRRKTESDPHIPGTSEVDGE